MIFQTARERAKTVAARSYIRAVRRPDGQFASGCPCCPAQAGKDAGRRDQHQYMETLAVTLGYDPPSYIAVLRSPLRLGSLMRGLYHSKVGKNTGARRLM